MEGEQFDRLTRWMRGGTSRRGFGLVLAGSLGIVAADDGEAKRKKKKKKKCGNSCGAACCTGDQVCAFTGGSTPRCINKIHTCAAEDNICLPSHSGQVWCNYDNDCKCHQTVAGQVACVADTVGTACGNCTQDSDCTASFGAGARCVQAGPGCTTTGCTSGFCKRACPA